MGSHTRLCKKAVELLCSSYYGRPLAGGLLLQLSVGHSATIEVQQALAQPCAKAPQQTRTCRRRLHRGRWEPGGLLGAPTALPDTHDK